MAEDPDGEVLIPLLALRDVALHQHHGQRQWRRHRSACRRTRPNAHPGRRAHATPATRQRQPSAGNGREQQRRQGQPVHADPGGRLDEHVADGAREFPRRCPTGSRESRSARTAARGPPAPRRRPAPARAASRGGARRATRAGGGDEQRQPRRDAPARRAAPATRSGRLEQDRLGDPVEPEHVVAEAEPPAAPCRHRGDRALHPAAPAGPAPRSAAPGMACTGGSAAAASAPRPSAAISARRPRRAARRDRKRRTMRAGYTAAFSRASELTCRAIACPLPARNGRIAWPIGTSDASGKRRCT